VGEGQGSLTGIPDSGDYSIRYDVAQGDSIRVFEVANSLGAQTQLAAALGSGHTGIIEYSLQDGNQGAAAARTTSAADLAQFAASADKQLSFSIRDPRFTIGRSVVANVTVPQLISGPFQIYQVTLTNFPIALVNTTNNLYPIREIQAGTNRRDLVGVLEPLA
jgi:hypothetical protein